MYCLLNSTININNFIIILLFINLIHVMYFRTIINDLFLLDCKPLRIVCLTKTLKWFDIHCVFVDLVRVKLECCGRSPMLIVIGPRFTFLSVFWVRNMQCWNRRIVKNRQICCKVPFRRLAVSLAIF